MATGHRKRKLRRTRNTNGKGGGMAEADQRKEEQNRRKKENAENIAHGNSVTKGQRENSMATGHMKQKPGRSEKKTAH